MRNFSRTLIGVCMLFTHILTELYVFKTAFNKDNGHLYWKGFLSLLYWNTEQY